MLTDRDKGRLAGVHPRLVSHVSGICQKFPMFVVQGVRTATEQQALYAQGRTAAGKIVTNCDGIKVKSNHQPHDDHMGHAVDLAWIPTPSLPDPFDLKHPWAEFGSYVRSLGLIWGGDFKTLVDMPHIELP